MLVRNILLKNVNSLVCLQRLREKKIQVLFATNFHRPCSYKAQVAQTVMSLTNHFTFLVESHSEPDYVNNLKKYFNDGYYTGTYYKQISSKEGESS